jgi:hypothetical protein
MSSITWSATRAVGRYAILLFAVVAPQGAPAAPSDPELARLWANFGVGYGYMSGRAPSPIDASGGGPWIDAQFGGRLSSQWLLGLNLGGLGIHAANRNYDPNNSYSSIYGQTVTNVFLVARFEPNTDHGWWFGAGGGKVLYGNKPLQDLSGNSRSGNGNGGIARIGYDWKPRDRIHFEAELSYELGHISLNAPFPGSFNYSVAALSAHIAYH